MVYFPEVQKVRVFETFISLQGESTYSGLPCFFIRLAGCNLRCTYCDTSGAWHGGVDTQVDELVRLAGDSGCGLIEVTGGEPLMQGGCVHLLEALNALPGRKVLVETNGSMDISCVPTGVVAVMDVKCPSSGQVQSFEQGNIARLRPEDEVKFVIADRIDYEWARAFIAEHDLSARCKAVLLSAVNRVLDPAVLGEWLLEDRLGARLQLQLHKVLGLL